MSAENWSAGGRALAALAVSAGLLALLFRGAGGSADHDGAGLATVLRGLQPQLVGAYLLAQLAQILLRARRSQLLLRGCNEPRLPGLLPLALVTAARNMFVDLLPARIGELSYVALLSRRYGVRPRSAVSSLGLAVLLDFVALLAVLGALLAARAGSAKGAGGLQGSAILLAALVVALAWALFRGLRFCAGALARLPLRQGARALAVRASDFLTALAEDVDAVRVSGALGSSLLLSLGLRVCKYAGLYAAFLAVTASSFGRLYRAPVPEVLAALIAGEGAAAIPVPSLMSFGTYESGGLAAFAAFGYPAAEALTSLLAVHLLSQTIDYTLGALGLIAIAFPGEHAPPARRRRALAALAGLCALAAVVFGVWHWQRREERQQGLAAPPPRGAPAAADPELRSRLEKLLGGRSGFVVWSSNRHGTHDILRMELPGGEVTRVTADPHTETYPRISPDGRRVAFSRSQVPWVSQRDPLPWDAWAVDAAGGEPHLLARSATGPFWSRDGARIFFQRNGGEFVEREVTGGRERTLFRAGTPPVPAGVQLQSPDYDETTGRLVATLRGPGAPRITALFDAAGGFRKLGGSGDCQVAWSHDLRAVFFVGHGGRQENAIYRLVPGGGAELWLDLPGELSHEYFPRQSSDGRFLVFAASAGGRDHEHDAGDYELFLWRVGDPAGAAVRLTRHSGNDCWPDLFLSPPRPAGEPGR